MQSTEPFSFEVVYRAEVAYLWRTLQRLGVPSSDLEDRAHDVFSVVYRKQDSFDTSRPIRPWLFGIAYRVASDARRSASRRQVPVQDIEITTTGAGHDEQRAKRRLVLGGLSELSIEQRAAVVMHDLDGYTAPEIAAALEVPLNTVYSRLRLGRARFVEALRRQGDEVK
ncbi:MAG: RNA polymerase sigma factor [Myxococcales bacterium]|nr:RNA polymerase sigma factor [Myxococcales bacterium]